MSKVILNNNLFRTVHKQVSDRGIWRRPKLGSLKNINIYILSDGRTTINDKRDKIVYILLVDLLYLIFICTNMVMEEDTSKWHLECMYLFVIDKLLFLKNYSMNK